MGCLASNVFAKPRPICGCCGGPRSIYSAAYCKDCYRKDTRPTQFKPVPPGVNYEQLVIVLAEVAARDERDAQRESERREREQRKRAKLERRAEKRKIDARNALPSAATLVYPYGRLAGDTDLMLVNSMVPRSIEGREDICQEILIALLEKRISVADLRANKGSVREFVAAFNRENFEGSGYVISLDEPRMDGRSWHDMLVDPSTVHSPV